MNKDIVSSWRDLVERNCERRKLDLQVESIKERHRRITSANSELDELEKVMNIDTITAALEAGDNDLQFPFTLPYGSMSAPSSIAYFLTKMGGLVKLCDMIEAAGGDMFVCSDSIRIKFRAV